MGFNLLSLLGDEDFWGGVASGASAELKSQDDKKDKDIRELRNFTIEKGLQVDKENSAEIAKTEQALTELASLIKGKRKVNDRIVREGVHAIVQQAGGVTGAAELAKKLNTQFNTFGRDPIAAMGFTDASLSGREDSPTYSNIARKYTKLKSMPKLSEGQLKGITDMTALDVIFGGKSAVEIAQEQARPFLGDTLSDQTQKVFDVLDTDFDPDMILGDNLSSELKRMYALEAQMDSIPTDQRDDAHENKIEAIQENISILKMAAKKTKEKTSMTIGERNSTTRILSSIAQESAGLDGQYDPKTQMWIPRHTQADITKVSIDAGTLYVDHLDWAFENGAYGIDAEGNKVDPYTFVRRAAAAGKLTRIVPADTETGTDAYLAYGDDIYDRNSTAFQNALPRSGVTAPIASGSGSSGGKKTPAPQVGAGTYKPSMRVQKLLPDLSNNTASTRKAAARGIMASIKSTMPGKNQTEYEAMFKSATGMDYQQAIK